MPPNNVGREQQSCERKAEQHQKLGFQSMSDCGTDGKRRRDQSAPQQQLKVDTSHDC